MAENMEKDMMNTWHPKYSKSGKEVVYSSYTKNFKTDTGISSSKVSKIYSSTTKKFNTSTSTGKVSEKTLAKVTKVSSSTDRVYSGFGIPDPNNIMTCYILNRVTDTVVKFPAYPTDVNESYSSEFNPKEIMGRSAPYFSFGGNGARGVSYNVKVSDDICPDLMGLVNSIKSLVYPKYYGSIVQPPFCYVKFGEMISMNAILDSVSFNWSETVLDGSQHFSVVEIDFSFQEVRTESIPTATGIFNEGSGV